MKTLTWPQVSITVGSHNDCERHSILVFVALTGVGTDAVRARVPNEVV